jgi:formyl-CoA transferase/CoA:oxalate CoA-transferase
LGTGFPTVAPYRVFLGSDGHGFAVAAGSEKLWSALCRVMERPDLECRPEFASNAARCENRPALDAVLAEVFAAEPGNAWVERLRAAGIPCTPVRTFAEVAADPQSLERAMFPLVDGHRVTGTPVKLSGTPGQPGRGAPQPGEHTESALAELLDLDASAVADLVRRGVIAAGL